MRVGLALKNHFPPSTSIALNPAGAVPYYSGFHAYDMLGLTDRPPKFAPKLGDLASPMIDCFRDYAQRVRNGAYPAAEHAYSMPMEEKTLFQQRFDRSQQPDGKVHQRLTNQS